MTPEFRRADALLERARGVLERERRTIAGVAPKAEVHLTGASSVRGALTSGDVDLHVRVPADRFGATVETLRRLYDVVLPEIWSASLATFAVRGEPLVGLAVTPIGSVHDRRFRAAWARLRSDPAALDRYNAMKRRHVGRPLEEYLGAKSAFFDELAAE